MSEQKKLSHILNIHKNWTLFLDRDGVINKRLPGDYVKNIHEFEFLEGVRESVPILNKIFARIIVVTNQQGVGKGIMSEHDLHKVHQFMLSEIEKIGGKIDAVYFSPYRAEENHPMRKPHTGMALKAKEDFPDIDFEKSIMVGDSESDMEFGKRCGMKTVFIGNSYPQNIYVDFTFRSLKEFTEHI